MSPASSLNLTHKNPLWIQVWVVGHPLFTAAAAGRLSKKLATCRPHHEFSSIGAASRVEPLGVLAHTFVARRAPLAGPRFNAYPQPAIDLEAIRQDVMETCSSVAIIMASQDKVSRNTSPRQNEVLVDMSLWGPSGLNGFPGLSCLERRAPGQTCQDLIANIDALCAGACWENASPASQVFIKEILRVLDTPTRVMLNDWLVATHRQSHLEGLLPNVCEAEPCQRL